MPSRKRASFILFATLPQFNLSLQDVTAYPGLRCILVLPKRTLSVSRCSSFYRCVSQGGCRPDDALQSRQGLAFQLTRSNFVSFLSLLHSVIGPEMAPCASCAPAKGSRGSLVWGNSPSEMTFVRPSTINQGQKMAQMSCKSYLATRGWLKQLKSLSNL